LFVPSKNKDFNRKECKRKIARFTKYNHYSFTNLFKSKRFLQFNLLPTKYKEENETIESTKNKKAFPLRKASSNIAVWTGLEPATPCVTGMYSNQLNYQTNCVIVGAKLRQKF
jgi:hypothetical protein